jgi:hypothetical protein
MKAFSFRLEQVLRWREMQLNLQRARVAAAGGKVSQNQSLVDFLKKEEAASGQQIRREPTGLALASYARHVQTSRVRIREAEQKLSAAQIALTAETDRLLESNRKLRLLEDLRDAGHREWRMEHERELAAFADEAFLGRVLRGTIGKRTGA